MTALPIMIVVLCTLAIAYRYYSAFLAAKVATLDDLRVTPAHALQDGHNYDPTNKWVLFGHHFAAISGAGPLIGPVLAAQFGYMPGLVWLLVGVCLAGAVQDFLVLAASLRSNGRSLAQIAREQIGPVSGAASIAAILFIIIVALAGLGIVVVKALGGEEFDVPLNSRIVLPADKAARAGTDDKRVKLPPGTNFSVPIPKMKNADGSPAFKQFPLSMEEDVEFASASDAQKMLAAKPGEALLVQSPARRLIPGSCWGLFTIAASIPIAIFMGLWMYVFRKNARTKVMEASIFGVVTLLTCVQIGSYLHGTALGDMLNLTKREIIVAMAIYGFIASVLPVWLLLCPRDYLSSYLKIGTIGALILGVLMVNPKLEAPAFCNIWQGNGPNFPGDIFPFLFITIMCGSISGFHALVSSGTTPKMVDKESDARMIGYGAMLMEGLVGIVAMIAAASLAPGDYYAIQIPMEKQAAMQGKLKEIQGDVDNLKVVEVQVGENLRGRTGGAVTLAVGMSKIFGGIGFFKKLIGYWYHFAIMFEALFILTTIDAGTRIGRFLVQEIMGKIRPEFGRVDWWPGAIFATTVIVLGWASLLWNGDVATIWPMFGIANQLLAVVALCVVTTVMFNTGKSRYAAVTLCPLAFIVSTTLTAGVQLMQRFHLAVQGGGSPRNLIITAVMLVCVVVVLADSIRAWVKARPAAAVPEMA
ncbi:MAG TPA: carbon starvation CstA family protein [Planctomycetota bacterium]